MSKLLAANFMRLWKDKSFWLISVAILFSAVAVSMSSSGTVGSMMASGYLVTLDDYFFNWAPMLGLFLGTFISLFLGTEYADGTIRNKILVGHQRVQVYLANYIICFAGGVFFLLIWWIGSIPGIFIVGELEMGLLGFSLYALIAVGFMAAFLAVFVLIGSLSSNKALTVVYSIAVWLVLLLMASAIYDRLCEPEMHSGAMLTVNGIVMKDPEANPLYVSGMLRTVLECILDFLPTGQAMLMADNGIEHPVRQIVFSVIFTGVTVVAGIFAFRRKDIK